MPVKNIKIIRPHITIPSVSDAQARIMITDDSGIDYTVMNTYTGLLADNFCLNASITKSSADKLGSFKIKMVNDEGRWLNLFNGGELVRVYSDFVDATTEIFRGRIDDISYGLNLNDGFFIELVGRDYPELIDKSITGIKSSSPGDIALAEILSSNYPELSLSFWTGSAWSVATYDPATELVSWSVPVTDFPVGLTNLTYQHQKGWKTIIEICDRLELDCYIEYNTVSSQWFLKTALLNSITNPHAHVSYGINLLSTSDYGLETSSIFNKAIVYGNTESDNIILLKTEEDIDSQSNLWTKDKVFNEGALKTMSEVQQKADYELESGVTNPYKGTVKSLLIPSIRPGELVNVMIPYCNIIGSYKTVSYTHTFGKVFSTELDLAAKRHRLSHEFIAKVNPEEFIKNSDNPNEMRDSYTVFFDEVPSKLARSNNVLESKGKLSLKDGYTNGSAVASTYVSDYNITKCELRRYENFATNEDVYYVSNTGGANWEVYSTALNEILHSFNTPGKLITFKIDMTRATTLATSPEYESICMLVK